MTDRVSEEEIESLILVELRHRDLRCAKTLRLLMEERSALEARLAEVRRGFAREALEKVFKGDDNGTPWESWAGVIDFLRREAGEDSP